MVRRAQHAEQDREREAQEEMLGLVPALRGQVLRFFPSEHDKYVATYDRWDAPLVA